MLKNISIYLIIVLSLVSCSKNVTADPIDAKKISDVSYGTDARQKMDVYLPADRSSAVTPLVILIHGGGWTDGDKQDFNFFIGELQKRLPAYAIANINYRLASNNNNLFPTQENDIKSAVEFLLNKSSEYKISKQLVLIGASAGAHLSLLQSYKHNSNSTIKAVVSLFGPAELVSLYNNPPHPSISLLLAGVMGGTPTSNPAIYQQSSPYNFVSAQSPPTLLFHGGTDPLVPASQSTQLKDKLANNGVVNQYVFYPSEGHGWTGPSLTDTFNKIEAFLKQQIL
jgi:acetyl esterase/lipase